MKNKKLTKNKVAAIATNTAIKVITGVLCGALVLTGTYGIIKKVVIPNTSKKTASLFEYEGTGDFGEFQNATMLSNYDDGECEYFYYTTLQGAIADANNGVTTNSTGDDSAAEATIAIRASDGKYIVKLLKDTNLSSTVNMSGNYIYDENGKTLNLASGAQFEITTGADITFRDSYNGMIVKDLSSSVNEKIINMTNANVTVLNGTYNCGNSGTGRAYIIYQNSGDLNIKDGSYNTISNGGIARTLQIVDGNTIIDNGKYRSKSETNTSNIFYIGGSTNTLPDVTINDGYFDSSSNTTNSDKLSMTIQAVSAGNLIINNGDFRSSATRSIVACIKENVVSVIVNNGKFIACDKGFNGGGIVSSAENLTINNGLFCGYGNQIKAGRAIINNGIFSGIHSGIQTDCTEMTINGGYFESYMNGGIYFCSPSVHIKNSTLKNVPVSELKCAQYFVENVDGNVFNNFISTLTRYDGCYVGSASRDVTVYMDNCTVQGGEDGIACSSNYSHLNTSLYISNCTVSGTQNDLRVGGVNAGGYSGHMYIGENVNYSTKIGTGTFDTTTYAGQNFGF